MPGRAHRPFCFDLSLPGLFPFLMDLLDLPEKDRGKAKIIVIAAIVVIACVLYGLKRKKSLVKVWGEVFQKKTLSRAFGERES